MKRNCWEHRVCDCGPDRARANDRPVCPVALEGRLDGVHGGRNGGRACWIVPGTCCNGERQGTFPNKAELCAQCDFYHLVQAEEGRAFTLTPVLLGLLQGAPDEFDDDAVAAGPPQAGLD